MLYVAQEFLKLVSETLGCGRYNKIMSDHDLFISTWLGQSSMAVSRDVFSELTVSGNWEQDEETLAGGSVEVKLSP